MCIALSYSPAVLTDLFGYAWIYFNLDVVRHPLMLWALDSSAIEVY